MPITDTQWLKELHEAYDRFLPLLVGSRDIGSRYALFCTTILWTVREASFNVDHKEKLTSACKPEHLQDLLRAIDRWDVLEPRQAILSLTKHMETSPDVRASLDDLLAHCLDDLIDYQLLKPTQTASSISITGDVQGGNIVIGGLQYIAGDLIVRYIQQKAERRCPTPLDPPEQFAGRNEEVGKLETQLKADDGLRLIAVTGIGGIGKTTIVQQVAYELYREKVFRAVLWVKVTPAPNGLGILRGWAIAYADSAFSIENMREEQVAATVKGLLDDVINEKCEHCEPERVLVVLDDVWDNGLSAIRLILSGCPEQATVLITTRSENLANNLNAYVKPLDYLNSENAALVLREYLSTEALASLRDLGMALNGHPFALELAARRVKNEAGRLPGHPIEVTLRRCLADYQAGIPEGTAFAELKLEPGETREDNLTVALSLSYEDLSEVGKQRFRALGTLAYDSQFDHALLASLWDIPAGKVDDAADPLRLTSLLIADPLGYRQDPLLRSYARALLRASGELDAYFQRYAEVVIGLADQFRVSLPQDWNMLELQIPHILSVGDQLQEYSQSEKADDAFFDRCLRFALNVVSLLDVRRDISRTKWLEMGLEASRRLHDQPREALFLNNLGNFQLIAGETDAALHKYNQALALLRTLQDRAGEALTLNNLGGVYEAQGNTVDALKHYMQALSLLQDAGDIASEAVTLNNIGSVYFAPGDLRNAQEYYERALPLMRRLRNKAGEAGVLSNMGRIYSSLGQNTKALSTYEQALALMHGVKDHVGEATILNNMGGIYYVAGKTDIALQYFDRALPLRREVRDYTGEAVTLDSIGSAYYTLADYTKARDFCEQGLQLRLKTGDSIGEARTHYNLARINYALHDVDTAIQHMELCIELDEKMKLSELDQHQHQLEELRSLQKYTQSGTQPAAN